MRPKSFGGKKLPRIGLDNVLVNKEPGLVDDLIMSSVRNAHKKIRGSSDAQSVNLKNRLLREPPPATHATPPPVPSFSELSVSWDSGQVGPRTRPN